MKNMLLPFGLFLLVVLPLTANDLKDRSGPNKPGKDITTIPNIGQDLYIIGPSVDYDAVLVEENAMPARSSYRTNRNLADTLAYVPADGGWNAYFYGYQGDGSTAGDAFMTCFQMPADGILKGVNVPIYHWGTGDQQITISLHKLSYPYGTDSTAYPSDAVDGSGWLGGYDMDASGWMNIEGSTYSAGGTAGVCDPGDAVIANAQDPLGTEDGPGPTGVPTKGLIWPDGFTSVTGNPENQPAEDLSVWYATADYGSEPELVAGDWVGVLVQATGTGGGDDPTLGFYYEAADGLVDTWVGMKFYRECGGTSGNGGWHIRHWMFNMSLAVEITGDRGPIFEDIEELTTSLSTDSRTVSCTVSDDNPTGEAAGVSSVTLHYRLDSLTATVNDVNMVMTSGSTDEGTWEGDIPGQEAGTTIYWSLTATDVNGHSTLSANFSYFIFLPTLGNDLIYNNQAMLYGILDYSATLYFYWTSVEETGFDIWDASYGSLTSELLENYDVLVELCGTGPDHIDDVVVLQWWGSDKTYIVAGDEWLGVRSGWANGETAQGSVAREVLGIAAEYNDINYGAAGTQSGVSRLMALEGDAYSGPLYAFMQNANADSSIDSTGAVVQVHLNYDPDNETGGSNWLDGVDAVASYTVNMTGLSGVLDNTGAPMADAETYNVMISDQIGNGGRSAFLAFDPIALNTQIATPHDAGYAWVGAHNYSGLNVSPLALAYEGLSAETNYVPYASAGEDQEVEVGSLVTLSGIASVGDQYLWTQLSGTNVILSDPTSAITSFTAPYSTDVLSFQLTVSNSTSGDTDTDIVNISVNYGGLHADGGLDQEVIFNSLVTLDGSGSEGANEYQWTQLSGTEVILSSDTTSIVSFTAPSVAGLLSFQLTVNDSVYPNLFDMDTTHVNVIAPFQTIVINEIMNNPSAVSDEHGEWIELYNSNPFSVYLNGWVIKDNDSDSLLIPEVWIPEDMPVIQPFSYFILGVNNDTSANGGIHVDFAYSRDDLNLGNSEDEIILYNPNGQEIDRVEYDNGQTFPDPNGKSMELIYFMYDNGDGINWSESIQILPSGDYATPGASNSVSYPELSVEFFENNEETIFLGSYPVEDTVYSFLLEIGNIGTGDLLLSSIETQQTWQQAPDSYIYTEYDQDSIILIPPFQQRPIEIYFYPPYSSIFHDTLMFTTNDSNYFHVEIPLEAWVTSAEREIHIEPSFDDFFFDTLEVGQTQEIILQVYNLGYTSLEIDGILTTPPFLVNPEDGSIETLGSMDVVVSFNPDSAGDYAGELVIESNDSDEGILTLILNGHSHVLGSDHENYQIPLSYTLHQNYPNPFNPITTLRYDLPENGLVNITVYDMLGRQVKTLINQTQDAGYRSVIWDATNDYGKPVSAGIYLYQIQAGEYMQTKKMVLLK